MRDEELEALVRRDLGDLEGLELRKMFGGVCWMWRGHLLCGAKEDGVLVRLGKGNDGWALEEEGVRAMEMGGRAMEGWVRLGRDWAEDQDLRIRLLEGAKAFVRGLPAK
ncbi:TfoX/Sxy family protein [Neogemmobacter tilapiae]|uniref:Cold-shock protein n=1 Tax=Neogemmobacter tilapiae TaxID=875041 RepID=A0A918TW27_9RHOB|nr:TfoX/Sxy family protein [Gemmobacter tilapiae]GHC62892.1 cold-shock protein [Gemmobacter tilapiae]